MSLAEAAAGRCQLRTVVGRCCQAVAAGRRAVEARSGASVVWGLRPPWVQCHHLSHQRLRVQALSRLLDAFLPERRPQGQRCRPPSNASGEAFDLISEPEQRTSATKS